MRTRRVLRTFAVASGSSLIAVLFGLVVNQASSSSHWGWFDVLKQHAWPSMFVLAAMTSLLALLSRTPGEKSRRRLVEVADRLASVQLDQLADEANRQKLNDPFPISVTWKAADPELTARWSALVRLATTGPGWPVTANRALWAADADGLVGSDNELIDVLERIPTGRLVVLGEPGAGKTILLLRLALDVLKRRPSGSPVPVLLPLTTWDPVAEELFSWIERWLILNDSALAAISVDKSGMTTARALLESGLIMPILDGLDEMPGLVGSAAIAQINRAMRPGRRLVLAARTADFQAAVHSSGVQVQLVGAAAVELVPLDAGVVITYLRDSAGGSEGAARWDDVFTVLADDPSAPLTLALTTPLSAALARAIYNPGLGEEITDVARHPGELLDPKLFATREGVEQHLFDWFIPAAYRSYPSQAVVNQHPVGPGKGDVHRRNHWEALQAARWLEFVADDLEHLRKGVTDFEWWRLPGAAPKYLAGLGVGILSFIVGAIGVPYPGLGIGIIAAMTVGLLMRRRGRRKRPGSAESLARGFAGGVLGGQGGALLALVLFGAGPGNSRLGAFIASGLAFGFAVAPMSRGFVSIVSGFAGQTITCCYEQATAFSGIRSTIGAGAHLINGIGYGLGAGVAVTILSRQAPSRGLHWSRVGVAWGVTCGFALGFAAWIQIGRIEGLSAVFVGACGGGITCGLYGAASPTDLTKAAAPRPVLARDRGTFLVCLVVAIMGGLTIMTGIGFSLDQLTGRLNGLQFGLGIGMADAIGVGLPFAFYQAAWGEFTLARCWLAMSHKLPWRLISFLDDARDRGVLRQVGAVYQFRHVDLQRRLAGPPNGSTALVARTPGHGLIKGLSQIDGVLHVRIAQTTRGLRQFITHHRPSRWRRGNGPKPP